MKNILISFFAAALCVSCTSAHNEFVQKDIWTDTDGNFINAHGAGILLYEGIYYMYGEYKVGQTRLNEGLGWEKSRQFDLGLDMRFLRDRLTATVDYYLKNTSDLIVTLTPPYITGQKTVYVNAGNVRNSGVELDLGWKDTVGDFNYSISANFSRNKNVVTYLDPTTPYIEGYNLHNLHKATRFQEGYPVWYMYGYNYLGIDENGAPKYEDLNGDGNINNKDMTMIGNGQPDFTYGITLSAEYKGIDLTVFGSGSYGNDIWFASLRQDFSTCNLPSAFYTDGFDQKGSSAYYPAAQYVYKTDFSLSSANIHDGSYFRINQIQLGYNFSERLLKPIHLGGLRLYVSLDDFFTFSKYIGFDPATVVGNGGSSLGIDTGNYPSSKKVMFGLNLSF